MAEPGGSGDPADDAADPVAVQRSAVDLQQPFAPGRPAGEQVNQGGVQGDVAVVAELADRDPQPPGAADAADGIGVKVTEFACSQPGAGEELDDETVQGLGVRGGGEQPGGLGVVEEPRERVIGDGHVDGEHRGAAGGVGPVPFDDPVEERPHQPEALADGVARRSAAVAGADAGEPLLVALDVAALDNREPVHAFGGQVAGEAPQGDIGGVDGGGPQRQRDLIEVAPGRIHELGCPLGDGRPVGMPGRAGVVVDYSQGGHGVTAVGVVASIASTARRYSPASQSLARCR